MVRPALAVVVGLVDVLVGPASPFALVIAEQTTVTWPAPGQPAVSSTALFAPYRPASLTAIVPCSTARTDSPFATSPAGLKTLFIAVQLLALRLLARHSADQPAPGSISLCSVCSPAGQSSVR